MANPRGNPQNLKPMKKGEPSRNPSGKPKQLLTKDKVAAIVGKFCHMTRSQLQDIITAPGSSMIEIMIASIMVQAAKNGDYTRLNFLFDRSTVGKVKEEIEHTINSGYKLIMEDLQKIKADES